MAWTPVADELIRLHVATHGLKQWNILSKQLGSASQQALRSRWMYTLDQSINRGPWTLEEDELLIKLHALSKGSWSVMQLSMPGRTDQACKNRYDTLRKRRVFSERTSVHEAFEEAIDGLECDELIGMIDANPGAPPKLTKGKRYSRPSSKCKPSEVLVQATVAPPNSPNRSPSSVISQKRGRAYEDDDASLVAVPTPMRKIVFGSFGSSRMSFSKPSDTNKPPVAPVEENIIDHINMMLNKLPDARKRVKSVLVR